MPSLLSVFEAELFSCADGSLLLQDTKHSRAALDSRGSTVRQFFSSLIDGCLKYKHKEKPKTGPRPGPRLNYDVKIGPIKAWSGRAEMQGSSVPLGRNHVSPSGAPPIVRPLESS